jgi:Bacterial Ig-like domain
MASVTTGTSGNDSWNLTGTYSGTLDGLGGVDILGLGSLTRTQFTLTQNTDGSVKIDTVAGASGKSASHIVLKNMELLQYDYSSSSIDLTTYFPTIVSFSPSIGASSAPIDQPIVLTFNKTITRGTGNIAIRQGSATGSVLETFKAATDQLLSFSNNTLTIKPNFNLAANTHYFVTIDTGAIKDISGINYTETISYDFTTQTSTTKVNNAPTGVVKITGVVAQNQTLTASNTLADADGLGVISYTWLRNGVTIPTATQSTYTLTQADVGKQIAVKASYTDLLGTAESRISSSTANVINAPTSNVIMADIKADTAAATQADANVASFTVSDTAVNITKNLATLLTDTKLTAIVQTDSPNALAITATQSLVDKKVLDEIIGTYALTVTGTAATDSLYDTVNSQATLTGGAGIDTFNVMGADTITDLGYGADIVKIAAGASINANLTANWVASSSTSNTASSPASVIINSNGFNVNVGNTTGGNGWSLNATGAGTTNLTGSIKSDIINGNGSGKLTINGYGGNDTIVLGTHIAADTIYLVANSIETIKGFGSSTGAIADMLNVTAKGNALSGIALTDKTALAPNNSPLAVKSGLVFSYADNGVALTAASAAALFSNTKALNEFAIAKGSGLELLIETGVSADFNNVVWEIKDVAGVYTAIELVGISTVSGHNVVFANLN